jgi:S1-C subfamily serine protease
MERKPLLIASVASGAFGGMLVVAVAVGVLAATVHSDGRTKTVTVQGAPITVAKASGTGHATNARQVYEQDASGVVFVDARGVSEAQTSAEFLKGEAGRGQGTATGSGFEIDGSGTILTNWHVVEGASKITVEFEHGKAVDASILGQDPSHDIAVLRIPTPGLTLHPLMLGNSNQAHVGDPVLAIGNPFGLVRTLTTGIVSAVERDIQAPNGQTISGALQTDAPINPGNSGGPLLNEDGEVIGINSQIETGGEHGGSVGIAFAIPINTAKSELVALR